MFQNIANKGYQIVNIGLHSASCLAGIGAIAYGLYIDRRVPVIAGSVAAIAGGKAIYDSIGIVTVLRDNIVQINNQLESLLIEKNNFASLNQQLSQSNEVYERENKRLAESVSSLERSSDVFQRENAVLTTNIATLKQQSAELSDSMTLLKEQNATLSDSVLALQKENSELRETATSLSDTCNRFKVLHETSRQLLVLMAQENETSHTQIEDTCQRLEGVCSKLDNVVSAATEQKWAQLDKNNDGVVTRDEYFPSAK